VCRRADDSAIPEPLRRLNFIFFDDAAQFEASADRLAEALQTDIGWVRQHTEFGEAARHWSAAGRPGGLLLRSPALEAAERWIGSRPHNAPVPTEETLTFVAESRRGSSRRRNILTGSLAAGLVLALALAGLAYWQRGIAVQERQIAEQQRQIAEQQRKRAEDTLAAATETANSLVFDLAQRFKDAVGVPAIRSKQRRLAARSVGVVHQRRRRAEGTGRPRGGAQVLPRQPRHCRAAGEIRSKQRRLAARSSVVVREDRRHA